VFTLKKSNQTTDNKSMNLKEKQYLEIAKLLPKQRGNVKINNRLLLAALIYRCENGCA
jgi:hypothetical protein